MALFFYPGITGLDKMYIQMEFAFDAWRCRQLADANGQSIK